MKINIVKPQPIRPKLTKYIIIIPDDDEEWFDDEEVNELMDFFTGEMSWTEDCWRYVIVNTERKTVDYLDRRPTCTSTIVQRTAFLESSYWANAFDHLNIRHGSIHDAE